MAAGRSHPPAMARAGCPAPWATLRTALPEACPAPRPPRGGAGCPARWPTVRPVLREAGPACGGPLAPWRPAPAAEPPHAPVALWRCGACGTAVTAVTADAAPREALHASGAYAPGA